MDENCGQQNRGGLKGAFNRASDTVLGKIAYVIYQYPSKTTAATGLVGDAFFFAQSASTGNYWGMAGSVIGAGASLHLLRHGDPKITHEEKDTYVDPQDKRNVINWVRDPKRYPWECLALTRMTYMGAMLAGGVAGSSYGEISYASFALAGYAIKMFVAQKEKGSVPVPQGNPLTRTLHRANADLQENPNTAAGFLWNVGLVPYFAEAVMNGEPLRIGSAIFYFLPNTFTMLSSKRAQVLPAQDDGPSIAPK